MTSTITIIACGIIIYFIFREWAHRTSNKLPLEKLTAEQIAELHRIEVEAWSRRQSTDYKIWALRVAIPLLCGSLMFLLGLLIRKHLLLSDANISYEECYSYYRRNMDAFTYSITMALIIIGAVTGVLIESIIELRWSRKSLRAKDTDN